VTEARPLVLLTPRTLGELLRDAFAAYFRHVGAFLAIGIAVAVPVQLVVSGIGLGQLSGGYEQSATRAELFVLFAEGFLIIGPLVTAMVVHALLAIADGRPPRAGAAITQGLEAFRPVFVPVLLASLGILVGFLLIVLPGIWLATRWAFTTQAVVVDGRRNTDAIARSGELVTGSWWRVFGIIICTLLVVFLPGAIVQLPFDAWGDSADSSAIALVGQLVSNALITPFVALVFTLLYFDLLARHSLPSMVPPVQPPPP
jgi:Membrane domain of glycerophosphoryl diester phosphodiesterase